MPLENECERCQLLNTQRQLNLTQLPWIPHHSKQAHTGNSSQQWDVMAHAYGPPHIAVTAAEAHMPLEHAHPTLPLTQLSHHKVYQPSRKIIFMLRQRKPRHMRIRTGGTTKRKRDRDILDNRR